MQGEGKKSFFHFPNPRKSVEDRKTCKAWLEHLRNARLPRKVEDYEWKISHYVCEDHFKTDCFEGAFSSSVASSLNFGGKKFLKRGSVPTIIDTSCVDERTGFADRRKKTQQTTSARQSRHDQPQKKRLVAQVRMS